MKYAKAWGHCDSDPVEDVLAGLPPVYGQTKHGKNIHYKVLGEALRIVATSNAHAIAVNALLVTALTGVRSGELRQATWDQFDLDKRLWHIPAANVKNNSDHYVPLTHTVIAMLKDTLAAQVPTENGCSPRPGEE